jgi:hypothetical protein
VTKRYKKIYMPSHPNAMSCGCVYEHRLIMEGIIGRYLMPEEQVHHQNGDKQDNDPSNLYLCSSQYEHSQEHAYDDDYMIDLIIRYNDVFGRMPSRTQCDEHPEMPHSRTYRRHFGTWTEAIRIARQKVNAINEEEEYMCLT